MINFDENIQNECPELYQYLLNLINNYAGNFTPLNELGFQAEVGDLGSATYQWGALPGGQFFGFPNNIIYKRYDSITANTFITLDTTVYRFTKILIMLCCNYSNFAQQINAQPNRYITRITIEPTSATVRPANLVILQDNGVPFIQNITWSEPLRYGSTSILTASDLTENAVEVLVIGATQP